MYSMYTFANDIIAFGIIPMMQMQYSMVYFCTVQYKG